MLALLCAGLAALAAIHFRETSVQPATVRFQMLPPEGATFGIDLALSPDGRRLAFMARPKGGQPLLWVRELDSLEARPLRGTEYGRYPFWSPDSRTLGFSTSMTLKKVEASGGPVQTLCNISNSILRGDWSPDGLIYFGSVGGVIYRVPQAGGEAVTVTRPDPAHAEDLLADPQILPDGRHLLYLRAALGGRNGGIYLASLDGKEKKRLVATRTSFHYAPPSGSDKFGHLLFLRENTLMAQPLDPKSFELRGDAFPVAEGIGHTQIYASFTISANGALAYRSGIGGEETQLTWFDRAGKPLGALGARALYNNIALSRDAARAAVVVESGRQILNADLWLFDLARGIPTQFTFHEGQDWDPVWSPDGSRVAFSSNRDGAYNLYLKDSTGGRPEERLHKSDIAERPCDWSRDGRYLMYTRGLDANVAALWVLSDPAGDPANRKAEQYLDFSTTQCQFSPDSHWVAYSSNESKNERDVYVQSFPVPSSKFRVSSNGGVQPRWRRDGKELFYIAADGKLMAVDVKTAPTFQAEIPHALFDPHVYGGSTTNFNFRYDVTPDGGRFLVNSAVQSDSRASEPITVVLNWAAGLPK
jgi:Tol biopolymer transport system component